MRKRYDKADEACSTLYDAARDDERFVTIPGAQWDEKLKARRRNRPTYEFPKLSTHVRQMVNEMRQSRPQGKVRGTEEGDKALAELMQGMCRNIEAVSNAEQAYDIGYEKAAKGGYGVWRLCTDYANEDDFDQDIFIEPVRNPYSVKFDPAAQRLDRRDGTHAFVEELMPEEEHERRFPGVAMVDFDSDGDRAKWREKGQIRLVEYWWKEPKTRELWALSSGAVVFADEAGLEEEELAQAGLQILRRRNVDSHVVRMRLSNGSQWLTEPHDFPSKFIPLVPVYGNIDNIDGEDYWQGMVRANKDQQRLHNVHRTAAIEAVAKSPKAPFVLRMGDIKGYERFWNNANAEDYPYLPVKDEAKELPERSRQAEVPTALLQLATMDNEDIKASTGQFNASLGATSNETSGKAINARKMQGAVATFNYLDNLAYAIRFTYEILVDMIPRVYDKQRVVRTLGADGGEKWKTLYQEVKDPETGQTVVLNDISKGKYDVAITVGPSYATQRMEAVDAFTQMLGQMGPGLPPPIAALMAYTAIKNMDLPGADELDAAFRKILVAQGVMAPAEGEEAPAPQQPDPKVLADASKTAAQAQLYGAQAEGQQLENLTMAQQLQLQQMLPQLLAQLQGMQPPAPPPDPMAGMQVPPQQIAQPQPPQGGFSLPALTGVPA
ncbi:portal protein [Xanthomonas sp. NCPPB 3005]|uniref:portal protein n=1 Tax=Xanthomonas sp. NCPPB 3005 TaxID=3240913 RepID=UPI003510D3A7